jgi:two-component system, LytTR family, response regulator
LAGTSNSVSNAFNLIKSISPDLVFLDIELTDGTGFDLLQKLMPYHFQVIFITAHNSFAVKAIRFSALDYLLKPVTESEFRDAVQKALELIEKKQNIQLQTEILIESYKKKEVQKKLVLRTFETLHLVEIGDICFCKSDNSYTTFYMNDNESIVVSKSLKEYENLLTEFGFFRPHQSYLVNLEYIKKVDKTDGGFIVMKNKKEIPVSSRQMKNLINLFEKF